TRDAGALPFDRFESEGSEVADRDRAALHDDLRVEPLRRRALDRHLPLDRAEVQRAILLQQLCRMVARADQRAVQRPYGRPLARPLADLGEDQLGILRVDRDQNIHRCATGMITVTSSTCPVGDHSTRAVSSYRCPSRPPVSNGYRMPFEISSACTASSPGGS